MAVLQRQSFARGWVPDADAVNGPADGLLRADNLLLDELGIVALRPGSAKVNAGGTAYADSAASTDVHSLYTAVLSGTKYRCAGVGRDVFVNGTSLASTFAGSGDICFGSCLGQILMARSTTTKKYDGTTLRNWGIAMTGGTPTVVATAADSKVLGSCDSTESPAFSANEGTIAACNDKDGVANKAITMTPDATTATARMTKTFATAQDYTTLAGGATVTDDDIVEAYLCLKEPTNISYIRLDIDVSDGLFTEDYYSGRLVTPEGIATPGTTRSLDRKYGVEGFPRYRIKQALDDEEASEPETTESNQPQPTRNAWFKAAVRRGDMVRMGSTNGKSWATVKAVRVVVGALAGGTASDVSVDAIQIVGGAGVTGVVTYRVVYVNNNSTYLAKSAPSAVSAEVELKAQGATVTSPADASRDGQVNEIWLYRWVLDAFYRVAVKTSVSGTGAVAIPDTMSDVDALAVNLRLETDNAAPPSNIIGIEGPYYDRMFCLTSTYLYVSRKLNPDSFPTSWVIRVADQSETAYWVKKAQGGLYIGTSKDIYRLTGAGGELEDGSLDFVKEGLNVDHPPISEAVAQEGNLIVYLASDGWRVFGGTASSPLAGDTSLLYRGQTRHGVSPVNLTGGRFRAAIAKGQFTAITPEGASTTSSTALYRYHFALQRWYRHTYSASWRCVHREPDGTLVGSDSAGFVWTLDTGTQDGGVDIPVILWTKVDDAGSPHARKDPADLRVRADTNGATASVAFHRDGSSTVAGTFSVIQTGEGVSTFDATSVAACLQMQLRVTGSFSTFRFYDFAIGGTLLPPLMRGETARTNFNYPGMKTFSGLQFRVCTLGVARTFTPVVDGVSLTTFAVTSLTDEPTDHTHAFTAAVDGVECRMLVDGDVEWYDWSPIITAKRPLGIKAWDSGPLDLDVHDLVWAREVKLKVIAGADLTITPWFDGMAFPSYTHTIGADANRATVLSIPVGRGFKGRTPRLVITSTAAFYPYWLEIWRRSTTRASEKKPIHVPLGLGGEVKA